MPDLKNLATIEDEEELHKLISQTEDFDERKKIRARMKEVREKKAAEYEKQKAERTGKQESAVEMRARQAEQHRQKTLAALEQKAQEKRLSSKVSLREEGIRSRQANAEKEKERTIQALNEKGAYISSAYASGKDIMQKSGQNSSSSTTKTETGKDGSTTTTSTTTSTQKSKDGSTTVTNQTKQITHVGGSSSAPHTINPANAEETANNVAKTMRQPKLLPTAGFVHVKTRSWSSSNGEEKRFEKTRSWGPGGAGAGMRPSLLVTPGGGGSDAAGKSAGLVRSPSTIKQMLLEWCRQMTAEYENVEIKNFSTSWNDGMAFCALIHHFYPKAFDYSKLEAKRRRGNFTIAFDAAEKLAGIAPLLDVDDMVKMKNPDWKCVFTYVQSFYRRFRTTDENRVKAPDSPVTPTTPSTPLSPEPVVP